MIRRRLLVRSLVLVAILSAGASPLGAQAIVAHRGASHLAPENTLAAFNLAWELGADAVEGDFRLTRDGRIVCMHDKTTKRTGSVDLDVAKSTFSQLRTLDVGRWKGPRWSGQRVPTLEEVLATVPDGKSILIEIKCGAEILTPLQRVLADAKLKPHQTTVIAFDAHVVAQTKRRIPKIKAYWLTGYKKDKAAGTWSPTLPQVLDTLQRTGADGLDTQSNFNVIDAAFVRALRRRDLEFHAWTVNDPKSAARLQLLGVDSITTDRPGFLREYLRGVSAK